MTERTISIQNYLCRAKDFFEAMKLLKDDLKSFKHSVALLAIHGAIAYSDAIRVGLGGNELSSEDHSTAGAELRRLLNESEKVHGVSRFRGLLSRKSKVAYSDMRFGENDAKLILVDAERFEVWVNTAARELKIEGCADAND